MSVKLKGWLVGGLVLGAMAYVFAQEDITLTTYYPSPRGMYDELRTAGDVHIGDLGTSLARLHVVQPDASAAFRVDDETGDATPFIIDQNGNIGFGTTSLSDKVHVNGHLRMEGSNEIRLGTGRNR